jgi:adenine-specific DNA-methyltransferase
MRYDSKLLPSKQSKSLPAMNYIGSKLTLLPFLEKVVREVTDGSEKTFCDLFAGTGAVGRHFKKLGFQIIANDLQYYAYVLNKAYLEINETPDFIDLRQKFAKEIPVHRSAQNNPVQEIFGFINGLPGNAGFITENFSPVGGRMYYTEENALKADAIRQALEQWKSSQFISEQEYFFLLSALLEAIDQVANTASVYGAYLKKFKASALKSLQLKPPALTNHVKGCHAFNRDANELIKEIECDILYLDPPYNHRQYGANYHVLETIAAYDNPKLKGITGMREYTKSEYCRQDAAKNAMKELISQARTKHILISYNDEGVMSLEDLREILSLRGEPKLFQTNYNRFKADNGREYKRKATVEYVHYVNCST